MGMKKLILHSVAALGTMAWCVSNTNEINMNAGEVIKVKNFEVQNTETYVEQQEQYIVWNDYYSIEEATLLASLVYAEARGQDDIHQQYVAQVVLNRVKSDKFPNTISEVVYQMEPTLQYACVENGQLSDAICMYESGELSEEDFEVAEIVYENVEYVLTENLEGNPLLPESVIYQSEFKQGTDVYDKIGNTYFCYE